MLFQLIVKTLVLVSLKFRAVFWPKIKWLVYFLVEPVQVKKFLLNEELLQLPAIQKYPLFLRLMWVLIISPIYLNGLNRALFLVSQFIYQRECQEKRVWRL